MIPNQYDGMEPVTSSVLDLVKREMYRRSATRAHRAGCPYTRGDYCTCNVYAWTSNIDEIVQITLEQK